MPEKEWDDQALIDAIKVGGTWDDITRRYNLRTQREVSQKSLYERARRKELRPPPKVGGRGRPRLAI